jgi:phosphatidylinositol kinase/protein kinase (PI-3  family)
MRHFSVELLRESPSPALRACHNLAQVQPTMARELFAAGFVSCWSELHATHQVCRPFEQTFWIVTPRAMMQRHSQEQCGVNAHKMKQISDHNRLGIISEELKDRAEKVVKIDFMRHNISIEYPAIKNVVWCGEPLRCCGLSHLTDMLAFGGGAVQEALVRSLEAALASPSIPPEIVTCLLNLAEFMEHDEKILPLDTRTLGALAEKCHAFAKVRCGTHTHCVWEAICFFALLSHLPRTV